MTNKIINGTVFVTGAAVLVIEVSATRTLSPYFGNTIFSISSILSVVLSALAVGYLLGGKIADRHPVPHLFFNIIWIAGISVLVMNFLARFFLHEWSHIFGAMLGPLVASIVLFFVPNFFLGMLSPFAITLKSKVMPPEKTGSNSGEVFFFSTAGSIVGSLATGFFLIPYVGISKIIFGTGVLLVMLGGAGMIVYYAKRNITLVVMFTVAVSLASLWFADTPVVAGEIYHQDGIYERIAVADNAPGLEGKRSLLLDRNISTEVFLKNGSPLATPYARYLELATLFPQAPRRILVLGGGAYAVPRYAQELFPEAQIDVVEIEPRLLPLAQKFFSLSDTSHMTTYTADGRAFLAGTSKIYDLIFIDVYSSFLSMPAHMTTKEFFELVQSHMAADGMVMMNVAGSLHKGQNGFLRAYTKTFSSVFGQPEIFALVGSEAQVPQNFVFAAGKDNFDLTAQSSDSFVNSIQSHRVNINSLALEEATLLTDDFAPIDYLNAPLVAQY